MNNIVSKAVAFGEALKPSFKKYTEQIIKNAKSLEKEFKKYNFKLAFGGTDNHMLLVDIFASKGLTGKEAEETLDKIGITINKNVIPDDKRSPLDPSGIRIGVPAITTRGMKEKEIKKIANWINTALDNYQDKSVLKILRQEVKNLCRQFPLYK
jgi:glycine hydroxymethyltransferase